MMFWGLVMVFIPSAFSSTDETAVRDSNTTNIQQAIWNINTMERDILRFYKQWDSLSRRIAAQGNGRAMEVCSREHTAECTMEKRSELTNCIITESKTIHDQVVVIYDQTLRKPWESEFEKLKEILEHPQCHSKDTVDETIWTVDSENVNQNSVRFRFYNSLINFQSPPESYPIDRVYQLCLDRLFTKQVHVVKEFIPRNQIYE